MKIKVNGLEDLSKKFAKLEHKVMVQTIEKTMREQIKLVQGDAYELCPVDSGDLRSRIGSRVEITDTHINGIVFNNHENAAYLEFGTGTVGQNTAVAGKYPGPIAYKQDKWKVYIPDVGVRWIAGQQAQPYLYPALKNREQDIIQNITNDLKRALKEVCKNG